MIYSYSILFNITGMGGLGEIRSLFMLFAEHSWQSVAHSVKPLTTDYFSFYIARQVEIRGDISHPSLIFLWRRRDMETLSALTALSVGDPLVTSVL